MTYGLSGDMKNSLTPHVTWKSICHNEAFKHKYSDVED